MLALTAALPGATTAAGAATRSADRPKLAGVQQALEKVAATPGVVGVIGEVYYDGKRISEGSAGSRLLGDKGGWIPSDARYRIGSQTKQMTATIVMQLVREGRLRLDDKLSDVLPQVAGDDLVERASDITVRHLIALTSGIPDYLPVDPFDFTTRYTPTELLEISRGEPRPVELGTWNYSNTNYLLLGMIIEKVTGRGLAAEFDRRLFDPLKMTDSYMATRPPQGIKGPHGHGYWADETGTLRDVDRLNASTFLGAAGVISTARDVSRFQRAFQQGRLLPADLQKVITDPPAGQAPLPPGGPCAGSSELLPGHVGAAPGFTATTYTSSDGRLQYAVSTTVAGRDQERETAMRAVSESVKAVFCPPK
ncbi:serine hydrolase domain-containing protein [Actinomadura opuntiae]|uniref:serine hydrolase domain-containing protein n=1 Tax=Actinomadura sp. OS1-43 TaxID=604315 RepID=UPI00255AFB65|nr:serine hydrolase domain-containing protein [Actinomadura sp. OS1-43]MDL4814175.1 serine hydrolase domain-containing protein [Actinomadura sp. OS1-43]